MRRFFKSAAFPILLVVILAFIAQRVISQPDGSEAPSYTELVKPKTGLIATGKIEEVNVNVKDSTLDVKKTNGESFSTGYPPNTEPQLLNPIFSVGASESSTSSTWSINQLALSLGIGEGKVGEAAALSLMIMLVGLLVAIVLVLRTDFFDTKEARQ